MEWSSTVKCQVRNPVRLWLPRRPLFMASAWFNALALRDVLSVEWIVINVGLIGRCKGRPQFAGGMISCVIPNSAAVLGARPLTAARRGVTAQEEKKSPARATARNPNVRSFTIIIPAFARRKPLMGCRVRIVPNCWAFRKRNRFALQT